MHKPESGQNEKTHKILRDFEKQMDNSIPTGKPDLVLIKKKTFYLVDFDVPAGQQKLKIKESEKINKYLNLARELKINCET